MTLSFILDATYQLRIKWVCDAGDEHTDRETALGPQAASKQVGMVIKPGNDLPDPGTRLFRNARLVIDDGRDGLLRYPGGSGNVVHRELRAARHCSSFGLDLACIAHKSLEICERCRLSSSIFKGCHFCGLVFAHQARHFGKKLEILCEVGRISFRNCILNNVLVESFPFCHEGIAPCRLRVHSVDAAAAIIFCHGQPDRNVPDVRRVILDSDYLLSSVYLKMSVETCDPVDAGLKLANKRAVIKGRSEIEAVTALRGKKHFARLAEQFTHRRKVMTTQSEHQRVGPPDSRR